MAVLSTLRAVTGHVGEFADVCPRMSRRFSRPGGFPQLHYWTVTLYDYYHLTSPRFHAGLNRGFSADCSYDSFSVVRPVQVVFRPGDRPDLPSYPGVNHRSSEPGTLAVALQGTLSRRTFVEICSPRLAPPFEEDSIIYHSFYCNTPTFVAC